jgi:hypothetical protein
MDNCIGRLGQFAVTIIEGEFPIVIISGEFFRGCYRDLIRRRIFS